MKKKDPVVPGNGGKAKANQSRTAQRGGLQEGIDKKGVSGRNL